MTINALYDLIAEHPKVAVYLSAPACGPADALRPTVGQIFGGDWKLVDVDLFESPEISGQLLVFATPTLLLYRDGVERSRLSRIFTRDQMLQAQARLA